VHFTEEGAVVAMGGKLVDKGPRGNVLTLGKGCARRRIEGFGTVRIRIGWVPTEACKAYKIIIHSIYMRAGTS
jgi:hypothetical protein